MQLMINNKTKETILLKKRIDVEYQILIIDSDVFGNNNYFISINKNSFMEKIFLEHDESIDFYLIENMLLFNFDESENHYCFNSLPEEYLQFIKNKQKINFVVVQQKEVDYYFSFDKIIGL